MTWLLDNVSFRYGRTAAINAVSAEIEAGCFYGIIGPNGSGKTTLLDLLSGMITPAAGVIRFNDRPLGSYRRRALARSLALVPQEFSLGFGFSVFDCVLMGRHCHLGRFRRPGPEDFRLVDEALAALDLGQMARRPITSLSGGEKQRVMVARALAQNTTTLLLDEATSNLDVQHTIDILRRCRRLVEKEGRTVVAVLHDLNLAAAFCDRVMVLERGEIAACGRAGDILTPELIAGIFAVEAEVDHAGGYPRLYYQYREE
jgi:iron complex transport system ATP-binding protein